jgi:hypothetical protein
VRALAGLLALTCAGCLYDQPLAPGAAEVVDHSVLGAWRCVAPDSADPAILTVTETTDRKYRAEFKSDGDEPTVFVAHAVTFGGRRLLNAQHVEDGTPGKWTLAQYALYKPTVLHLEFATNEPFRAAADHAQRVEVLRKELTNKQLFEDYCTCIRVRQ